MDHDQAEQLEELLVCHLDERRRATQPCTIVIFGASGDLTSRKLIPALYQLSAEKRLPQPFRIVGVARRDKTSESWRGELLESLRHFSRTQPIDAAVWEEFARNILYCRGDLDNAGTYQALSQLLASFDNESLRTNLLFYLATPPSEFAGVAEFLHRAGLLHRQAGAYESQIYRIDHYLGKETVQNILMFRFSNATFEQLWTRQSVDHVQITVSEKMGVGGRGGYYEEAGALRDMVQNHLLQVMALVAMEPPVSLEAEAIRDEKVKLLKSIRLLLPPQVATHVVRGQYAAGMVDGQPRAAYRQEPKVAPDSNVETFVALKLFIDNWRWSGVPFFVRTGKNLPLSASEVRVQFQRTPHVLFAAQCGPRLDANSLTLRLQPNEGITLRFNGKIPGPNLQIRPVRMHFSYDTEFGAYTPEAYERLLLEALAGDATLFIRRDEVETAWAIVDCIRAGWDGKPLTEQEFYAAGTWGPAGAAELLTSRGLAWRNPEPPSK
jgi:glucose-6-phosphate 1-dehydrogenase